MMRIMLIGLACTACVANMAAAADGLGRLFFSPAQRAQLDATRAQRDRRAPVTADTEQAVPQGPDVLTYSGLVRRSDGKSTVWINRKAFTERNPDSSDISVLNVRRDGAVSVAVPQAERTASLKVGQSIEVTSGTIEESYARRVTIPKPPKPAPPGSTAAGTKPPAAVAAPTAAAQRAARRDTKASDPDSGAAPPVERGAEK
jgi:hypothetical protein